MTKIRFSKSQIRKASEVLKDDGKGVVCRKTFGEFARFSANLEKTRFGCPAVFIVDAQQQDEDYPQLPRVVWQGSVGDIDSGVEFVLKQFCGSCGGSGVLDSGGVTPWGSPIYIPCPHDEAFSGAIEPTKTGSGDPVQSPLATPDAAPPVSLEDQLKAAKEARDHWLWAYSVVNCVLQGIVGWETAKEIGWDGGPLEAVKLAKSMRREIDNLRLRIARKDGV